MTRPHVRAWLSEFAGTTILLFAAALVARWLDGVAGVTLGRAVLGAAFADPPVAYAAIQPAAGWSGPAVFLGEAISVVVMMAFVVAFMDRPALARWTPAVVAAAIAVLIFAGGLTSGGSFNPARQLGPLLFAGRFSYLWAYMLGPLAGATILAVLAGVVRLQRPLTCSLCGTLPPGASPERPTWDHMRLPRHSILAVRPQPLPTGEWPGPDWRRGLGRPGAGRPQARSRRR